MHNSARAQPGTPVREVCWSHKLNAGRATLNAYTGHNKSSRASATGTEWQPEIHDTKNTKVAPAFIEVICWTSALVLNQHSDDRCIVCIWIWIPMVISQQTDETHICDQ